MDDFKRTFGALSSFVQRMTASQALMLLGVTAGLIAGIVVVVNFLGSANYSVLYSGLDQAAAGEVIAYLDESKIPYELSGGGGTIMVPDDRVYKARMSLAAQGLPSTGTSGYSIFDETNFGMTDFLQKLNYKRALEGELTRSIMEIREVRSARVHIVIPQERLFAKDKKEPTASILLKLAGGELSERQISGIKHLVASSVEGLAPSNISIIDYEGNLLSSDQERDSLAGLSASQLGVRKEVESYLERKAQSMLDDVIGRQRAVVRISAELDFTQVERTNELYDGNGAVVRSEERSEQSSNAQDKTTEETSESTEDSKTETTVTNYEIPRTMERIVN
ncbi:MAG TPA: flagellar basal-body MS-ring/collar protein FliF, partial [candidate division Zixibacteria bacterium]|nr:flagellar basal-body MS-ring/collar protein FliF [candidate division Zixibacteria bacterium]